MGDFAIVPAGPSHQGQYRHTGAVDTEELNTRYRLDIPSNRKRLEKEAPLTPQNAALITPKDIRETHKNYKVNLLVFG
jgi:hypothetical protein